MKSTRPTSNLFFSIPGVLLKVALSAMLTMLVSGLLSAQKEQLSVQENPRSAREEQPSPAGDQVMSTSGEHQVGPEKVSTVFSFYNTSPESPNGKLIAYVRCKEEPYGRESLVRGELWVCDRNLKQHRKVTSLAGTAAHNGVEAQWIDNKRIALFDNGKIRLVDIQTGCDLLKKNIKAAGLGHNPYKGKILYGVNYEGGVGEAGIYELDCNTLKKRLVLPLASCAKIPIPAYLQHGDISPLREWRAIHCQYSPDGKKIAFRLDIGPSPHAQLLGICGIDGSGLKIMNKSLHFIWYDNESLIGHFRFDKNGKRPKNPEKRNSLTRWDLNGNIMQEMMTPPGNHLAMSPGRRFFVSETFYQTNPVVVKYYKNGQPGKAVTITSFDPHDVTWKRRFHVNPAFSRDGKRIYYSRPLNEKYAGTFFLEIE